MFKAIKSLFALAIFFMVMALGVWASGRLVVGTLEYIGISHTVSVVFTTVAILFGSLWSVGFVIDSLRISGRHEGLVAAMGICLIEGPEALMEMSKNGPEEIAEMMSGFRW